MILGYGHDDRVCAYPSARAILDFTGTPERTLCAVLTDKEEIGSVGATGMRSHYFENIVSELYHCVGEYSEFGVKQALANSRMPVSYTHLSTALPATVLRRMRVGATASISVIVWLM